MLTYPRPGPLKDAIRLATHNDSQPVHHERPSPPMSISLLQAVQRVGRVANKFIEIYPVQKWNSDDESPYRRNLQTFEVVRLRRAIYRLWLYTKAYHTSAFPRTTRRAPEKMRLRAALLRSWPANELAEIVDVQAIIRVVIAYEICPSDAEIRKRSIERISLDPFMANPFAATRNSMGMLGMGSLLRPQFTLYPGGGIAAKLLFGVPQNDLSREAWGDESNHYHFMEDMLKLSPDLIIMLYEHCNGTHILDTEGWLEDQDNGVQPVGEDNIKIFTETVAADYFAANGQTFGETLGYVLGERGEDLDVMRHAVTEGEMGIVKRAFW